MPLAPSVNNTLPYPRASKSCFRVPLGPLPDLFHPAARFFKAKQLFFTFELHEAEEDVQYVLEQYLPHGQFDDHQCMVNKRTILRQRRFILELFGYRTCAAEERQQLQTRARQAAKVSSKPI